MTLIGESPLEAAIEKQIFDQTEWHAKVEALLFAAEGPLSTQDIFDILQDENLSIRQVNQTIVDLVNLYESRGGGFRLFQDQGHGYQFRTRREMSDIVERMYMKKPRPLSRAAQETLAIIAYRQPTTRAEIEFIRGVDAGSIIKNLLERDMIVCVGRKEIAGRPMLFATTEEFLRVYNLASLKDLPSIESFQPEKSSINSALAELESKDLDLDLEQVAGVLGFADKTH